jgi:hypothetical protein
MSLWRREAIERFPELQREIADAAGMYFVWMTLRHKLFRPAYEKEPPDLETAARVYEYAAWSLKQPSVHVRFAAGIEFYQWLADDPRTRRDMPRWIPQETFDSLHFAWDFYMTRQDYADLRREFAKNKARIDKQERSKRTSSASG